MDLIPISRHIAAMPNPLTLKLWTGGINSLLPPTEIAPNQYQWGENVIARGGVIQTRPGRRVIASIFGKQPQGCCIFQPTNSTPRLVAAVDGLIYQLVYPSFTPQLITGITMSATAKQIVFQGCIKSVQRNADNSLKLIPPYNVLVIQDGIDNAAYWDGSTARHLDPTAPASETPIGTWMAFLADRLWIANGPKIFVCDLSDPLSHTEAIYLSERDNFILTGDCTGLIVTSNRNGILAFTADQVTAFQANNSNRTTWATTANFQEVIVQQIGCVSPRTIINQYGTTHWMSDKGMVSLDIALASQHTSRLNTEDENMMRSRRLLAPDMSGACGVSYENLIFVSVPAAGINNEQTWVMDQAPLGAMSAQQSYSAVGGGGVWAAVWTGTRPVQWATGKVGLKTRLYSLSFDATQMDGTQIHVWEDMLDERTDEGGPISCQWISGIETAPNPVRFKYATFEAIEILGSVNLDVFITGTRGPYYNIGNWSLQAEEGCFGSALMPVIEGDSIIEAYRPQSRSLVTQTFNVAGNIATVEQKPYTPGVDKGFSICFEWQGRMGFREITLMIDEGPSQSHGLPANAKQSGAEVGPQGVDEGGNTVSVQT